MVHYTEQTYRTASIMVSNQAAQLLRLIQYVVSFHYLADTLLEGEVRNAMGVSALLTDHYLPQSAKLEHMFGAAESGIVELNAFAYYASVASDGF